MRSQQVLSTLALAMQAVVHCHLLPPAEGEAQGKIDVHAHFMPPEWRAEVEKTGGSAVPPPPWSPEDHLELMKAANISKSIVSIPQSHLQPGEDAQARRVARYCNQYADDLKKQYPEQFGYWATLPLPDVEGALAELAHVFDNLNPDGVGLLSNHHGVYLGDAQFDPIFAELNRRKATVFIHPAVPCTARNGSCTPSLPMPSLPQGLAEYMFDETRVFFNLFTSGTVDRFPNIRYVISHAGGTMPPILERFSRFKGSLGAAPDKPSADIKAILAERFYFDLSGFVLPDQIHGLRRLVPDTRLLFGSDFPYTPFDVAVLLARELKDGLPSVVPNKRDRVAIYRGNAQGL